MALSEEEGRVVGSLIEKQLTTPQQYPLSLNALVLACNQTSNREPVVSYDEGLVEVVLSSLKDSGLVRFVLPSHGRSVVRYRHVLEEKLGLDTRQLALLAVLLLRGPQTAAELRSRTDRMARFDGVGEVEHDLGLLSALPEPLAVRHARRPGQKEERWAQLLAEEGVSAGLAANTGLAAATDSTERPARPAPSEPYPVDRIETLEAEVARLGAEVQALRAALDQLIENLGS